MTGSTNTAVVGEAELAGECTLGMAVQSEHRELLQRASLGLLVAAHFGYAALFIYSTSFVIAGQRNFCLFDDAMISMTYGRNLAEGRGLVWNTAERVEGYTNPAWTMIMAGIHVLPVSEAKTSLLVQCLAAALLGLNLVLVKLLTDEMSGGHHWTGIAAAFLTATYYPLNNWALQGMEVALLAPLLTGAVLLVLRARSQGKPALAALAVLAATAWVRLDAVVPCIAVLAYLVASDPRHRTVHLVGGILLLVASVGTQTVWRLAYYGDLLPNTFYLKMTGFPLAWRLQRGVVVLLEFIWSSNLLLMLLPCVLLFGERKRHPARLLLLLIAAQMAYSAWVGGDAWEDWGGSNRYIVIVMPLFFVVFCVALRKLVLQVLNAQEFPVYGSRSQRCWGLLACLAAAVTLLPEPSRIGKALLAIGASAPWEWAAMILAVVGWIWVASRVFSISPAVRTACLTCTCISVLIVATQNRPALPGTVATLWLTGLAMWTLRWHRLVWPTYGMTMLLAISDWYTAGSTAVFCLSIPALLIAVDPARRNAHLLGLALVGASTIGLHVLFFPPDLLSMITHPVAALSALAGSAARVITNTVEYAVSANWVILLPPLLIVTVRRERPTILVWGIVGLVLLAAAVGEYAAKRTWIGAPMPAAAVMPLFWLLFALAVDRTPELVHRVSAWARTLGRPVRVLACGLALLAVTFNGFGGHISLSQWLLLSPPPFAAENEQNVLLALELQEVCRGDAVVAVTWAGAVPYFSRLPAVDLLGKSDRRVARSVIALNSESSWRDFVPGHVKRDLAYSLGELRPDVIMEADSMVVLPQSVRSAYSQRYGARSLRFLLGSPRMDWSRIMAFEAAEERPAIP